MNLKKILILSLIPISILAFKPSEKYGIFGVVWNNVKINHLTITTDGISKMIVDGKELKFSPEALEEIKKANADVDNNEAEIHAAHCDAEAIGGRGGCGERLINKKNLIIEILSNKNPNITLAREELGKALHTLQDFYAHSNWVNMDATHRGGVIYSDLTETEPYIAKQDKYEGVEDNVTYKTCVWTLGVPDELPLPILRLDTRGKKVITTGWFAGILGTSDPIHYKCDHGISKGNGLNKDTQHQKLHEEAATVAITHTKKYLQDILKFVLASGRLTAEEKAKNIAKFFGETGNANLGFIVDTTGSMGDTVTGVKNAMTQTVNKLKADGKDINNFYLISFGDPGVGSVLTATDADSMLANINTVRLGVPDSGGDRPEKAMDGLLKVVNVAAENTELYLYTDADTKNRGLASTIITTAKAKNITINFFLSGRSDSSYTQIASATGGSIQSYTHSVAGAERTFALVNPKIDGNLVKLQQITGTIPGSGGSSKLVRKIQKSISKNTQEDSKRDYVYDIVEDKNHKTKYSKMEKKIANGVEHDIVVDSSTKKIVINVEMRPIGTITLFKPDGTEISDSDAGVTITTTSANKFITVESPDSGKWLIRIEGTAGQSYSLDVSVTSETKIVGFDFVELKGRAGHKGLFPLDGQPLNTAEQYIQLTMTGDIKTIEMYLVSLDGKELKKLELKEYSKNEISSEYFGQVSLPSEKFKVLVRGTDSSDYVFERLFNQVYIGQTVSVKPNTKKPIILQPNKKAEIGFTVHNTGVKDTFTLVATKEDGSTISLDSSAITLKNNESKVVLVQFIAPNDIATKLTYSITLSVESKINSDSKNSAIYRADVTSDDIDNDGVSDKMEKFINDGNKDGIVDYNQSNVISILSESAIGFTFELRNHDNHFNSMFIGEVPEVVQKNIEGKMPFGLFDFEVSGTEANKEMKVIYSGNIYPTEYYKYDDTSSSWVKDTTAVFEKGYAIITLGKTHEKGFFVFNNKKPSAYVEKQKISKNESITLDLLANAHDGDGDTIRIIYIDTTSHKGGTITKVTGSNTNVTYTPLVDYNGTDYFQYKITDDKGGYSSIDVEIKISNKIYDFDGDNDIDIVDINKVVNLWNTKVGDVKYNSVYDLNNDNIIDIKDIMMVASMWELRLNIGAIK